MDTTAAPQDDTKVALPPHAVTLLLAIASRCRKGLTTTVDADALEELARLAHGAH